MLRRRRRCRRAASGSSPAPAARRAAQKEMGQGPECRGRLHEQVAAAAAVGGTRPAHQEAAPGPLHHLLAAWITPARALASATKLRENHGARPPLLTAASLPRHQSCADECRASLNSRSPCSPSHDVATLSRAAVLEGSQGCLPDPATSLDLAGVLWQLSDRHTSIHLGASRGLQSAFPGLYRPLVHLHVFPAAHQRAARLSS